MAPGPGSNSSIGAKNNQLIFTHLLGLSRPNCLQATGTIGGDVYRLASIWATNSGYRFL